MNAIDTELLKLSLSPVTRWMDDPEVTDILVYGSRHVYARRRGGGFKPVEASWQSDADLMTAAKTMGRQMSRRLDAREPVLDARLPDGSRVNIVIDPCYNRGACIAIRKFPGRHFTISDLADFGAIDEAGAAILEIVMRLGKNILVSGGTGSGKTTLLNSLCGFIPEGDIVVTVEDAREIAMSHDLWVALETRRAVDADDREVTLRDLVRASLRMNPRWIIVGEVRGPEALDLVRAFNTGHCGAGTIHASSAYDALLALESLILQSGLDVPARAAKEMVSRAIQVVVHMGELPDHSRRVMEIAEVQGLDYDRSASFPPYRMRTLHQFEFDRYDADGKACGKFFVKDKPTWVGELRLVPGFETPSFWIP
ncbi:MAG: Flp pilus assembly complex ATPase component TadA [Acidobacteriota bacterium]|nr:Flp pilus assembly complex ATPase component TadA [Acidobacteriota bacterium]